MTAQRLTKLMCTLGPATEGRIDDLIRAGMDVARVNFSHGDDESRKRAFDEVRAAAQRMGRPVSLLADLQGPKVRLGELDGGEVRLHAGSPFVLGTNGIGDVMGARTNHAGLVDDLRPGDRVLLSDGAASLQVERIADGGVVCEVERGGVIRSGAGVNVPSDRLSMPAVTAKDRADLERASELGVDRVAQSFVRSAADVRELRASCSDPNVSIVAKIETRPAVDAFEEICAEAEAVMVARGDLGVELAFEEIPVVQKHLVAQATAAGVPVVVATQMLESMVHAPRPTRAEASDVANAVWDGADALLLSAETAIGDHPVEAAATAARICISAEREVTATTLSGRDSPDSDPHSISRAAARMALDDPDIAAIACFTRTGRTAALLAAARPHVPIHAFTPNDRVARRLALHRAVIPTVCEDPGGTDSMIAMMDAGLARPEGPGTGAFVVLVASIPAGTAQTNLLKVHHVGAESS